MLQRKGCSAIHVALQPFLFVSLEGGKHQQTKSIFYEARVSQCAQIDLKRRAYKRGDRQ
jgi:hypothetical protein